MPKRRQPEFELHCVVADLLRWAARPGVHWFHIPNGEHRPKKQNAQGKWYSPSGERLKRMGVKAGEPDFVFLLGPGHPARVVGMELKPAKGGVESDAQKAIKIEWSLAGALYRTVVGYEEAVSFLDMLGIIRIAQVKGTKFEPRKEGEQCFKG